MIKKLLGAVFKNGKERTNSHEEDKEDKEGGERKTSSTTNEEDKCYSEEILFSSRLRKKERLYKTTHAPVVDVEDLRGQVWKGVSVEDPLTRSLAWKLLLDYYPQNQSIRDATVQRKREEYLELANGYFSINKKKEMSSYEESSLKQIILDVKRTGMEEMFQMNVIKDIMVRILFIWTIRHPASGYVQGINDLLVPFILVIIVEHLDQDKSDGYAIREEEIEALSKDQLDQVEADAYWCLSKIIEDIQDNYTDLQPGVSKVLAKMKRIVECSDKVLA